MGEKIEEVEACKSALVNEYNFYLVSKYGSTTAPNRLADIFLFYTDLAVSLFLRSSKFT